MIIHHELISFTIYIFFSICFKYPFYLSSLRISLCYLYGESEENGEDERRIAEYSGSQPPLFSDD